MFTPFLAIENFRWHSILKCVGWQSKKIRSRGKGGGGGLSKKHITPPPPLLYGERKVSIIIERGDRKKFDRHKVGNHKFCSLLITIIKFYPMATKNVFNRHQFFLIATRFTTTKMGPILIIQKLALGEKNAFDLAWFYVDLG